MGARVGTRTLNWTCGLFATALSIAILPPALWSAYWAWLAWEAGVPPAAAYYAAVTLLWLGVPVVFLRAYDRWQTKRGLQ